MQQHKEVCYEGIRGIYNDSIVMCGCMIARKLFQGCTGQAGVIDKYGRPRSIHHGRGASPGRLNLYEKSLC